MQPDYENPHVRIVLRIAMLAGVALMATQLWNASEYRSKPIVLEQSSEGFSAKSAGDNQPVEASE